MKKLVALMVAVIFVVSVFCTSMVSAAGNDLNGADKFLKEKFNADATKEFKELRVKTDELGMKHVKLQQIVNGIPVYGSEYIVHFDKNGEVYASNGNYDTKAKAGKTNGNFINVNEAIEAAKADVDFTNGIALQPDTFGAELYLYEVDGQYIPVYLTTLNWLHEDSFGYWAVFVNAETGKVEHKFSKINYTAATATGTGVLGDTKTINVDYTGGYYYLRDLSRGAYIYTYNCNNGTSLPGSSMYDTDTTWNSSTQKAAVDAHYYAGKTYDFYKNVLGRNGINNANMTIKSSVHYSINYVNAFWNGSQMVYGDGDGVQALALSGGLDVVAHELSHGVDSYEANLAYENQSGALNESFSDIMGCAVEFYAQSSKADWLMGEDIWTPGTSGDALRSLSNPELYNQPATMSNYQYLPNTQAGDWGGVHTNSGIPNKAGYLMGYNLGYQTMAKIWYRAMDVYMTSTTNFSNARACCLQAAADLYGSTSTQYTQTASAFSSVGIY